MLGLKASVSWWPVIPWKGRQGSALTASFMTDFK